MQEYITLFCSDALNPFISSLAEKYGILLLLGRGNEVAVAVLLSLGVADAAGTGGSPTEISLFTVVVETIVAPAGITGLLSLGLA